MSALFTALNTSRTRKWQCKHMLWYHPYAFCLIKHEQLHFNMFAPLRIKTLLWWSSLCTSVSLLEAPLVNSHEGRRQTKRILKRQSWKVQKKDKCALSGLGLPGPTPGAWPWSIWWQGYPCMQPGSSWCERDIIMCAHNLQDNGQDQEQLTVGSRNVLDRPRPQVHRYLLKYSSVYVFGLVHIQTVY